MAQIIAFDRRASHFVASKPEMLDLTQDINALAAECYGRIQAAYEAHWLERPTEFLHAITTAGEKVVHIGKLARAASGRIEAAPEIPVDQLTVWVCDDQAVVGSDGVAA